MLYKKELKKVPLCEPAKSTKKELKDKAFVAGVKLMEVPRCGKTLIIDYYNTKDNTLQVRFFSDGNNYTIYDVQKDKWTWSYVNSVLFPLDKKFNKYPVYCSENEQSVVMNFLNIQSTWCWIEFNFGYSTHRSLDGILAVVDNFIERLKRDARCRARDNAFSAFKERQSWFPEPDQKMNDFCNQKVFCSTYLFFSSLNKKRKRTCTCSRCGKSWVTTDSLKHKSETVCPKCSSSAVWFAERYQASISERSEICQAYKHDDQLIIRWQWVDRTFYNKKPVLTYTDDVYTFYLWLRGKPRTSSYFWLTNNGYCRWSDERLHQEGSAKAFIYTENLNEVFGEKYYNVNLKTALETQSRPISITSLLANLKKIPQAEYLCKLGLAELASELDDTDYTEGSNFGSILGVNPQYLSMYRELHITSKEHYILRGTNRFVSVEEMLLFRKLSITSWMNDKVIRCLQYQKLGTLCSYLLRVKDSQYLPDYGVGLLSDYYEMCEALDIPINKINVRPKDLRKVHDVLVERYNKVKAEIKDKKSKAALALINHWFKDYEKDGYCVKVPEYRSDFIREGQALSHCVGNDSYYNNHKAGTRMIFFIRKADAPDVPYVTAEIDMVDFRLLQCYGAHDKPPIQMLFRNLLPETRWFLLWNAKVTASTISSVKVLQTFLRARVRKNIPVSMFT